MFSYSSFYDDDEDFKRCIEAVNRKSCYCWVTGLPIWLNLCVNRQMPVCLLALTRSIVLYLPIERVIASLINLNSITSITFQVCLFICRFQLRNCLSSLWDRGDILVPTCMGQSLVINKYNINLNAVFLNYSHSRVLRQLQKVIYFSEDFTQITVNL